jgi:hypothetical protein
LLLYLLAYAFLYRYILYMHDVQPQSRPSTEQPARVVAGCAFAVAFIDMCGF